MRPWRWIGRVFLWVTIAFGGLVWIVLVMGSAAYMARFGDSVTLPNGMILKREFVFWMDERSDMFTSNGKTLLARDIEFVCFNDRYVEVWAYDRKYNALYDGKTDSRVPYEVSDQVYAASGLGCRHGCNGYYTGMVGPGLLYDGLHTPFLPSCAWRNLDNPARADRSWFDRTCDDD